MINFRYHLVSLTAVFLSLTLGIALGSTVVKSGVLDQLNKQIVRVSSERNTTDERNKALSESLKQRDDFIASRAPKVVENLLAGAKIVVLAQRGVDANTVKQSVQLLQHAGAESPAIIWLEPKWLLASSDQRSALHALLPADTPDSHLLQDGLALLSARIVDTSTSANRQNDAFTKLREAGFISIEAVGANGSTSLDAFPGSGGEVISLIGRGNDFDAGAVDDATALNAVAMFAETLGAVLQAAHIPAVFAERDADLVRYPQRGTVFRQLISSSSISTVDSLDSVIGQVALVEAMVGVGSGPAGHYGYGPGATRPLPKQ